MRRDRDEHEQRHGELADLRVRRRLDVVRMELRRDARADVEDRLRAQRADAAATAAQAANEGGERMMRYSWVYGCLIDDRDARRLRPPDCPLPVPGRRIQHGCVVVAAAADVARARHRRIQAVGDRRRAAPAVSAVNVVALRCRATARAFGRAA